MPSINKLLDKVNQASQAIKSVKGIKSKIQSIGYKGGVNTEEVDKLQEQAEESRRKLEKRRASLQDNLSAVNKTKMAKGRPSEGVHDLQYPLDGDMDNFIVFETRNRKARTGGNMLSKNSYSIALYLPEDISQTTSVGYEEDKFGQVARGANNVINEGAGLGGMMKEVENFAKSAFNSGANVMTAGIQNLRAGMAENPMKEQTLKGMDMRTHDFEFSFKPKSEAEAEEVTQIINIFRLAMLPDTFALEADSPNENFFNYPNVFDVYIDGPIAKTIEGFLPMVLSEMSVETFGGNSDALLGASDDEFYSAATDIKLSFKEIKILSQEVYNEKVAAEKWRGGDGITNSSGSPSILDNKSNSGFDDPVWSDKPGDDG